MPQKQRNKAIRVEIVFSVLLLLVVGHLLAMFVSDNKQTAWMYVTVFYAAWLLVSLIFLVSFHDIKKMFAVSKKWQWNLVFVPTHRPAPFNTLYLD